MAEGTVSGGINAAPFHQTLLQLGDSLVSSPRHPEGRGLSRYRAKTPRLAKAWAGCRVPAGVWGVVSSLVRVFGAYTRRETAMERVKQERPRPP